MEYTASCIYTIYSFKMCSLFKWFLHNLPISSDAVFSNWATTNNAWISFWNFFFWYLHKKLFLKQSACIACLKNKTKQSIMSVFMSSISLKRLYISHKHSLYSKREKINWKIIFHFILILEDHVAIWVCSLFQLESPF